MGKEEWSIGFVCFGDRLMLIMARIEGNITFHGRKRVGIMKIWPGLGS